jgi:hypothetical protein
MELHHSHPKTSEKIIILPDVVYERKDIVTLVPL